MYFHLASSWLLCPARLSLNVTDCHWLSLTVTDCTDCNWLHRRLKPVNPYTEIIIVHLTFCQAFSLHLILLECDDQLEKFNFYLNNKTLFYSNHISKCDFGLWTGNKKLIPSKDSSEWSTCVLDIWTNTKMKHQIHF